MVVDMNYDFRDQTWYNLVNELFENLYQQVYSEGTIKSYDKQPHFTAEQLHSFNEFGEWEKHTGFSTLIEYILQKSKGAHTGKASFIPVECTYDVDSKLHMAYLITVALAKRSRDKPALIKDDSVYVMIEESTPVISNKAWRGEIISATEVIGMEEVTMFICRPMLE
ncbi:hypothetical protein P153DRAFT_392401 [Dothidotthia symphoricarpi CBS 119687]|uniref:Uncharacterized protein n=1 Tax=Dothidotthia symphoricarpi CBS 119687 TaxID=1392245 RepID=A0A6A6ARA4_9PLEO|nr:uncharacterized protein P153DRAFT_392401 [Dothidotthia symphoricarpi CBS 119687]KAF2133743.1 hypothetical protein P153DRAFT_392401 [Dothidotthia symphoricarpi CBS 119687]